MGQRMMLLRPSEDLLNKYLMYYLNSPKARTLIIENVGGTASPHINVGDIKNFTIPIIPFAQQQTSLADKGYLVDIVKARPGNFVCLPVNLQINSIKSMIAEMTDILKLAANMQKVGIKINGAGQDTKQYENILKSIQVLFAGEEILYETESFAITGNILDENLYQGTRSDLINAKLTCLAQVKRVYPDGTELMKNTIFTKIKDASAKDKLITSMQALTSGNVFDFEATAVSSIYEKPVYQLEIIALYQ